eukprot:COSAG01_NODE_10662_length_2109_cov_51.684577_1_plen_396_part_00
MPLPNQHTSGRSRGLHTHYVSFENMSEYLIRMLNEGDCGPLHLCGSRHMSWMNYFLSTTLIKKDREYIVGKVSGASTQPTTTDQPPSDLEKTMAQKKANTAAREELKTKAANAFGGLQGVVFLAFMYAMYDWLVNKVKPVAKYANFWRENEKVCSVCGSHDHMCLDCNILDDDQHQLGRAKNYAVPADPKSVSAKRAGRYFFWRNFGKEYRPENRVRPTGGIDTAPDVRTALQSEGKAPYHILDPKQPTSLPTTYDAITDTPLQSRPFLLERINNVTASDLNPDGTLKTQAGAMRVQCGSGSKHICDKRFVGEIVQQLSGKVRMENGMQVGTVFELGETRGKHPSIDDEMQMRLPSPSRPPWFNMEPTGGRNAEPMSVIYHEYMWWGVWGVAVKS